MAEPYSFGRFILNPREPSLYADGVPVPLGPTDLRLLIALVESGGDVVPKDELVSRVWGSRAIGDNALYVHINSLRKALGDDIILNKQGRGYRFVKEKFEPPRTGNVPTEDSLSRLIGRAEQLQTASRLLLKSRLLTLSGPGGVGKSKLALHLVSKKKSCFPHGIWSVELCSLRDPDSVLSATAAALGIAISDTGNPLQTLGRHLARKKLLLILDNCEHVIGAVAALCEEILAAAPDVRILATSREALGCAAEQILEIPPLAFPPGNAADQLDAICGSPAIELFLERAGSADASFRMTESTATIVSRICRRVDGLPLAIEMVAGWVGVAGVETLEAKLDGFIRGWLRACNTGPTRHSTLAATLEWSHDLLSETEQTVLRRLAVFAGRFTLEEAEAATSSAEIPPEQVLGVIAGLVRKSMVAVVPESQGRFYRLLETTRTFMLEKLSRSADYDETKARHARCVLNMLECAVRDWELLSDAGWRERYGPKVDDLRNALGWAMEKAPVEAIALAGASWPLWLELSLFAEGRRRIRAASTLLNDLTPLPMEARLLRASADFWVNTTKVKALKWQLERAEEIYRGLNDRSGLGDTLVKIAFTYFALGQPEDGLGPITEALSLLDPLCQPRTFARAFNTQMCILFRLGRAEQARSAGAKALALCERVGADRIALTVKANLIEFALDNGDVEGAIAAGRELRGSMSHSLQSDLRGFALAVLTAALVVRGELDESLVTAREAAPLLRDSAELFWLFDHLALRSGLAGRLSDAGLLAGYADSIHEKSQYPRWPMGSRAANRLRELLHDSLSTEETARLGEVGAQLSEDQALMLALSL